MVLAMVTEPCNLPMGPWEANLRRRLNLISSCDCELQLQDLIPLISISQPLQATHGPVAYGAECRPWPIQIHRCCAAGYPCQVCRRTPHLPKSSSTSAPCFNMLQDTQCIWQVTAMTHLYCHVLTVTSFSVCVLLLVSFSARNKHWLPMTTILQSCKFTMIAAPEEKDKYFWSRKPQLLLLVQASGSACIVVLWYGHCKMIH